MPSVFSLIIAGDIPSYKVAEDDRHYAFLDINPLAEGHTLVVPKREVDYIFDLSDEEYAALQLFAKRVARAVEKSTDCKRIATAVIGLEVPRKEKLSLEPERMAAIAAKIASNFE